MNFLIWFLREMFSIPSDPHNLHSQWKCNPFNVPVAYTGKRNWCKFWKRSQLNSEKKTGFFSLFCCFHNWRWGFSPKSAPPTYATAILFSLRCNYVTRTMAFSFFVRWMFFSLFVFSFHLWNPHSLYSVDKCYEICVVECNDTDTKRLAFLLFYN